MPRVEARLDYLQRSGVTAIELMPISGKGLARAAGATMVPIFTRPIPPTANPMI